MAMTEDIPASHRSTFVDGHSSRLLTALGQSILT